MNSYEASPKSSETAMTHGYPINVIEPSIRIAIMNQIGKEVTPLLAKALPTNPHPKHGMQIVSLTASAICMATMCLAQYASYNITFSGGVTSFQTQKDKGTFLMFLPDTENVPDTVDPWHDADGVSLTSLILRTMVNDEEEMTSFAEAMLWHIVHIMDEAETPLHGVLAVGQWAQKHLVRDLMNSPFGAEFVSAPILSCQLNLELEDTTAAVEAMVDVARNGWGDDEEEGEEAAGPEEEPTDIPEALAAMLQSAGFQRVSNDSDLPDEVKAAMKARGIDPSKTDAYCIKIEDDEMDDFRKKYPSVAQFLDNVEKLD